MSKETIKPFFVGNTGRVIITDSNINALVDFKVGDTVKIREDIDELASLDGFILYNGMKEELTSDNFHVCITDVDIDTDNGLITLELNNSGYSYPVTVLEALQDCTGLDISDNVELIYDDADMNEIKCGDRVRIKPDVVIGGVYGLYNNIRYTPKQFIEFSDGYEVHDLALPGEFVTIQCIDHGDNTVLCEGENKEALWYGIEMLQKPWVEEKEIKQDDEFMAFVEALKAASQMAGIDIAQIEEDLDDDYDNYDDLLDDDYEDDLLDERYDGNRSPDYEFNFYQALEELKFNEEIKNEGSVWVMVNGERAFSFKDNRLVGVRLADSVDNFVYYSAPIQMEDLESARWKLKEFSDEEIQKIDKLVEMIETLKDENLAFQLLDIIGLYV